MPKIQEPPMTIDDAAIVSWAGYEPDWLLEPEVVGKWFKKSYTIDELRIAYMAGFHSGVAHFITKEG